MADEKRPARVVQLNLEATVVLPEVDFEDPDTTEAPQLPESMRKATPAEPAAELYSINARHAAALRGAEEQGSQLHDELAAARLEAAEQIAALEKSLRDLEQARQASAAELRDAADRVTELSAALNKSQSLVTRLQQQSTEDEDALRYQQGS